MKGLAWDDDPKGYFERLITTLRNRHNIDLEIEGKPDRFMDRFYQEQWDFVCTDLVNEASDEGEEDRTGLEIAEKINQENQKGKEHIPIFIVTAHFEKIDPVLSGLGRDVIIKSKRLSQGWMAAEIKQELVERGIFVDPRKVFVISESGALTDGTTECLRQRLDDRGLVVEIISGANLNTSIHQGLLDRMVDCAAVIAVCTADDTLAHGARETSGNELFEIGNAMGHSRGIQRLTILQQQYGPGENELVSLPSDLGGIVTLRFREPNLTDISAQLENRLRTLGVTATPPS